MGVLIIPVCIILAWAMGQPLDLNFNEFEAAVLFISVLLAVVVLQVRCLFASCCWEGCIRNCGSASKAGMLPPCLYTRCTKRTHTTHARRVLQRFKGPQNTHCNSHKQPTTTKITAHNATARNTHTPQDGSSNYLKGLLLVLTYCFISAGKQFGAQPGGEPACCLQSMLSTFCKHLHPPGFWLHKDPLLQEAIDEGGHPR